MALETGKTTLNRPEATMCGILHVAIAEPQKGYSITIRQTSQTAETAHTRQGQQAIFNLHGHYFLRDSPPPPWPLHLVCGCPVLAAAARATTGTLVGHLAVNSLGWCVGARRAGPA